jgi:hypothetical protein
MAQSPRSLTKLPDSTCRQLNMYALAASAAGVTALAMAQPAEGKIVYTPTNRLLHYGLTKLDLDKLEPDAEFEFCLSLFLSNGSTGTKHPYSCPSAFARRKSHKRPSAMESALSIYPHGGRKNEHNRILGTSKGAFALPIGVQVGPKIKFAPGGKDMATWGSSNGFSSFVGPWASAKNCYLGLKFLIKGKTHYGWARLTVVYDHGVKATLTGYAYETIPGKAIVTGVTKTADASKVDGLNAATLSALALGAPALSIWQRQESADATTGR